MANLTKALASLSQLFWEQLCRGYMGSMMCGPANQSLAGFLREQETQGSEIND